MDLLGLIKAAAWLVLTFFFAYFVGGKTAYFIFYTSLGLLGIGFAWTIINTRISAHAYGESITAQVGQKVKVTIEVRNNSGWPVPWLQYWVQMPKAFGLLDDLACYTFSLKPQEKKGVSEELECQLRGCFQWANGMIKTGDPFGIYANSKQVGESKEIMVLPEVFDLGNDLAVLTGRKFGEVPVSTATGRGGSSFIGVRKYDSSDGISRIHWKASAKAQGLLVKEFQVQRLLEFGLYLDLSQENHAGTGREASIEKAVSLAASIAGTATKLGYGIGMTVFGLDRATIPINYGRSHYNLILETLVKAEAGGGFCFGEVMGHEIALLRKQGHAFIITGRLEEHLVESLFWLTAKGQGSTVFLIKPETFDTKEVDFKERANCLQRLQGNGISVFEIEQGSDLRLMFRRLEHGIG